MLAALMTPAALCWLRRSYRGVARCGLIPLGCLVSDAAAAFGVDRVST